MRTAACRDGNESGTVDNVYGDNTASTMSIAREYSIYQNSRPPSPEFGDRGANIAERNDSEGDEISTMQGENPLPPQTTEMPGKIDAIVPANEEDDHAMMPTPTSISNDSGHVDKDIEGPACSTQDERKTEDMLDLEIGGTLNDDEHTPESPSSIAQGTSSLSDEQSISHESISSSATPHWDFSNLRLIPQYPSSFLRPGTCFTGTQQSDRQIYNVDVEILTISIPQSSLSGYLRICGLTEDHPTLTTFFSGEIIGGPNQRYTFQTKHPDWGATEKTDMQHWARFPAWRPLKGEAKRDINFTYPSPVTGLGFSGGPGSRNESQGWWQKENIFMRWKEWFLVPDHRVRSIQGASFEGFYYICFNQVEGQIDGIYFHARSEK